MFFRNQQVTPEVKAEIEEQDISLQQQEAWLLYLKKQPQSPETQAEIAEIQNSMMGGLDKTEGIRPKVKPVRKW
jgi:hypothetical protein